MNGKQAKALRKVARRLSDNPTSFLQHSITKSIVVNPDSTRGYYLQLKRQYKRII